MGTGDLDRRQDADSFQCGLSEPGVIADEGAEIVFEADRAREVQRVKRAKLDGVHTSGKLANALIQLDQRDALQHVVSSRRVDTCPPSSTSHLDCAHDTRDMRTPVCDFRRQRFGLGLALNELHERRRVEVEKLAGQASAAIAPLFLERVTDRHAALVRRQTEFRQPHPDVREPTLCREAPDCRTLASDRRQDRDRPTALRHFEGFAVLHAAQPAGKVLAQLANSDPFSHVLPM